MTHASRVAGRFQTLDGLRGLGAITVLLLHFGSALGISSPAHGYLAVDLFFCLSGFVLTRSYAVRISNGMKFQEWICVRLIRLYPIYFLSIALGAVGTQFSGMPGSALSSGGKLIAMGTGVLMIPSPTWNEVPEMFPLNFVTWSLSIEMMLSVLFYWSCRWRNRTLAALLVGGLCGLALVRWRIGYVGGGFAWRDVQTGVARGLYGFSSGMLIARYQTTRLKSHAAWLPIIAAGVMMWLRPPHGVAYDILAIVVLIPVIASFAACIEPETGIAFRIVGDLSYAVYALHNVSFSALERVTGIGTVHPQSLLGILAFALFLTLCALLDRYYDRPIRKVLLSRLRFRAKNWQ